MAESFQNVGGISAFTLVLQTWTQNQRRDLYLYVHAPMACGALADVGRWIEATRGWHFLFPVHALWRVLRSKFMQVRDDAGDDGALLRGPAATESEREQGTWRAAPPRLGGIPASD